MTKAGQMSIGCVCLHVSTDAQKPFELSMPDGKGPYVVILLDMDAPFVSLPFLGPVLHWVQSGFRSNSTATLTSEGVPFICDYVGPAPPPGSGPHRYCYFVYDQPADFDPKKFAPPNGQQFALTKRMRTDLDAYERELNLGPILACNYYTSN